MDLLQACCNSRKLLADVLLCIQDPIIVTDLEGHILFSSSVVEKTLGFEPDELKGKNLSVFFTPEDLTCLYPNLFYMARKNEAFEGELMLFRKDRSRFFAFMTFRICIDPGLGKTVVIICIKDIERLKRFERTITGTPYEDLVEVANGIAHELRNPLVGIGGFVNRLYKSCRSACEHDKYYDYIIDNIRRIEGLVKKTELFARLPKPCFMEKPIREVVENALRPYLQQMEGRRIDLTINVEEVKLFLDADLIMRVFSVLIENAVDSLPEEGRILIDSEINNNQCKIYVKDTGSGILPENIPYVFNPFFSTKPDGVGIDLAVVKRIMESHGGHVDVISQHGEGTTFVLLFPVERRRPIRIYRLQDQE